MTHSVDLNTYNALQAARKNGIIIRRNLVWIKAKNRSTGAVEEIGLWEGHVAQTFSVVRPSDGVIINRVYQPASNRMTVPPIPEEMTLKVRALSLDFSALSPAIYNATRVYDARKQPIEIHRAILDPVSRKQVAPAICRWDGMIDKAPGKRPKAGDDGKIEIQTVSHPRWLTMASGDKMDAHFFEARGDQAGRLISTIWRVPVPWGQSTITHPDSKRPKERFFR